MAEQLLAFAVLIALIFALNLIPVFAPLRPATQPLPFEGLDKNRSGYAREILRRMGTNYVADGVCSPFLATVSKILLIVVLLDRGYSKILIRDVIRIMCM